ncbi:MAG: hypothetical protein Q9199_006303 [Rusavskia elegans]
MSPSEALAGLPALVTGGDESVWENCGTPLGRTVGLSIGAGKSLGGCTLARLEPGCAEELTSGRQDVGMRYGLTDDNGAKKAGDSDPRPRGSVS